MIPGGLGRCGRGVDRQELMRDVCGLRSIFFAFIFPSVSPPQI